jgi:hypothetical protein
VETNRAALLAAQGKKNFAEFQQKKEAVAASVASLPFLCSVRPLRYLPACSAVGWRFPSPSQALSEFAATGDCRRWHRDRSRPLCSYTTVQTVVTAIVAQRPRGNAKIADRSSTPTGERSGGERWDALVQTAAGAPGCACLFDADLLQLCHWLTGCYHGASRSRADGRQCRGKWERQGG